MNKILTLTGPSCSGKTTLAHDLVATGKFVEIISFTSRDIRAGEIEGVNYYYKTRNECQDIITYGEAIEHIEFNGNIYGTEKSEINLKLMGWQTPLIILEPHGLHQYQEIFKDQLYRVYIDSTEEILADRFLTRFSIEVSKGKPMDTLLAYESKRLRGMLKELREWPSQCEWDFYVDHFTSDNRESIVQSVTKLFHTERKEESDQSRNTTE